MLMQVLLSCAYQLPLLLGLLFGGLALLRTPLCRERTGGILGLLLVLLGVLFSIANNVITTMLISSGRFGLIQPLSLAFGISINLLHAAGVLMLLWMLVRRLRCTS